MTVKRTIKRFIAALYVCGLSLPSLASASETQGYTYDAKGRLVKVERTGTINSGVDSAYEYDKAGSRTRVKVTGSA